MSKKNKKLFAVWYSIIRRSDGEIITEAEQAWGYAETSMIAQFNLAGEVRQYFSHDEYILQIHQTCESSEQR